MVFPGGIFTSTPVFGLRPIPFFPLLDLEHAESPKLDSLTAGQGAAQALDHGIDGLSCFDAGNIGDFRNFVHDIGFDHEPSGECGL